MANNLQTRLVFRGHKAMSQKLAKLMPGLRKQVMRGLEKEANEVVVEAKEIVPYKSGDLSRTIRVEKTTLGRSQRELKIVVSFGGRDTPYAIRQHEDLSLSHAPGKSAKFVEIPLKKRARHLSSNIAKGINLARIVQ